MRSFLYSLLAFATGGTMALQAQQLPGDEEQTPVAIGVYGNYHITNHTLNGASLPGIANCCPDFTNLDGSSIALGGLVEIPLSNALRLSLRTGYQNLKTTFTAQQKYGKGELNNNVVEVTSEKSLEARIPMITVEPELAYRVVGNLDVRAGVRTGFLMSPAYHYEERVVSENFTFSGSKTRNATDGDFAEMSSIAFFGVVGLSYDLPFGKNIFAPEVRYAFPLNKLSDAAGADWQTSTLHLGAAFKVPLRSSPAIQIQADTLYQRDTTTVSVKGIAASRVKLEGSSVVQRDTVRQNLMEIRRVTIAERYVREQPAAIALSVAISNILTLSVDNQVVEPDKRVIEQMSVEDNFPLLPYVFFPEGSSDLRQTRLRILTPQETVAFSMDKLSSKDALGLYPDLLNVLGYRMRTMQGNLTLTGCNSDMGAEQGNTSLSAARAQAIKDYLTSVWGVEPRRITVKARNLPAIPSSNRIADGQEENQRVEISGRELLRPTTIRDFVYESSFRRVRIDAIATADAGLRSWKVTVSQSGQLLKEFTGTGSITPIVWDVDAQKVAQSQAPVVVRVEVADNEGQQASAEQSLSVRYVTVQAKRTDQKEDKLIERYFLVLFDYNRAELNADHRESIQQLGDKLRSRPDAAVTIHGYTDRIGTSLSNEQLAQRRAELVRSTLKYNPERVTLLPVGSKTLLFDNDHPVGRFYSRTVEIVVETSVKN